MTLKLSQKNNSDYRYSGNWEVIGQSETLVDHSQYWFHHHNLLMTVQQWTIYRRQEYYYVGRQTQEEAGSLTEKPRNHREHQGN